MIKESVRKREHGMAGQPGLRAVVAIPVCNEAERIEACLQALDQQVGVPAECFGVVLFLNNCTDGTADIVRSCLPRMNVAIKIIERVHEGANAGWARREAMEAAAAWLAFTRTRNGVILTTDADSRVRPDWIRQNLKVIDQGADAVAGRITLDPDESASLPAALHARGRLEGGYEAILTELSACIDPDMHDPWPCHWTVSGATLAVRASTYHQVGGMPPLPLGEDRAFVAVLRAHGMRVRHAPQVEVITSGRLVGRAQGGAADTMKRRCDQPDSPCDPRLERLQDALYRYAWRRRLRRLFQADRLYPTDRWASALLIAPEDAARLTGLPTVGRFLAGVETASPRLAYRPLQPSRLKSQIRMARLALQCVKAARWTSSALARVMLSWRVRTRNAARGAPVRRRYVRSFSS